MIFDLVSGIDLYRFDTFCPVEKEYRTEQTNQYKSIGTEKIIRKDLFGTDFQSQNNHQSPHYHSLAAHHTPPWPIAASTLAAAPALLPLARMSAAQQRLNQLRRLHALRSGAISNFSCLLHPQFDNAAPLDSYLPQLPRLPPPGARHPRVNVAADVIAAAPSPTAHPPLKPQRLIELRVPPVVAAPSFRLLRIHPPRRPVPRRTARTSGFPTTPSCATSSPYSPPPAPGRRRSDLY